MYFIYIYILTCEYIKHYNEDLYICRTTNRQKSSIRPSACTRQYATDWYIDYSNEKAIVIYDKTKNNTLTIVNNTYLGVYPLHDTKQQQFEIVRHTEHKYSIMNNNKCIQYDPYIDEYLYKDCDVSDDQMFTIIKQDEHPVKEEIELNGDEEWPFIDVRNINNLRLHRKSSTTRNINRPFKL